MKINKEINEGIVDAAGKSMDKELAAAAERGGGHYFLNTDNFIEVLDRAYNQNLRQMRNMDPENPKYQPINILAIGTAGTAKSGVIEDWCQSKNVHLLSMTGSELDDNLVKGVATKVSKEDPEDPEGENIEHFKYLPSEVWDELDIPGQKSILFLDELNRSYTECRAAILALVQSHKVAGKDPSGKSNKKFLKNFVMTIAAVNPPDKNHKGADLLDLAMLTRFYIFNWEANPKAQRDYWIKEQERMMAQSKKNLEAGVDTLGDEYTEADYEDDQAELARKIKLIKKLITPEFTYTTNPDELGDAVKNQRGVLNARTVYETILFSDGTVQDFLELLPGGCGIAKTSDAYKKIKLALTAKDKDDVTNAWKDSTKSLYDRIANYEYEVW